MSIVARAPPPVAAAAGPGHRPGPRARPGTGPAAGPPITAAPARGRSPAGPFARRPAPVPAAAAVAVPVLGRRRQSLTLEGGAARAPARHLAAVPAPTARPAVRTAEGWRRTGPAALFLAISTPRALSPPALHLLAEGAGPAVVCVSADYLPGDLVDLDALAQPADVGRGLVEVRFLGVDLVDVHEQLLDGLHEGLVGGALWQDQRLDHGGIHGARGVWLENREPVCRGQVVPRRRRVSMHGRHDPGCRLCRLRDTIGRFLLPAPVLWFLLPR